MNSNIFLLLGTNLGDRTSNLDRARQEISAIGDIKATSSIFKTAAWGKTDQPAFYNQVIKISTFLAPVILLEKILSIEAVMGRVRDEKWGPRIIDIDILFFDDKIINTSALTVPHPGIPDRMFTLLPLHELAPLLVHPVLKKNISTLLKESTDTLEVERLES
jgi:2-amino-4-hydroxy-6-hydroxymethyldihydropteridine diphosphokinase